MGLRFGRVMVSLREKMGDGTLTSALGRDITNYLGCLDERGRDVQPVWDEGLIDVLGGVGLDDEYLVRGG